MNFATLSRIGLFTVQTFWRNIWLSLATITIITLAFISINVLLLLNIGATAAIQTVQNKVDVSIYFKTETTEAQVLEAKTYLSALPSVEEVTYTSQQDALERFRQLHQNEPTILSSLEQLSGNPLGASLAVKTTAITDYPEVLRAIEQSKYNELIADKNFDDHQVYIESLSRVTTNIRRIAIATTAIFAVISLLIVFNTIRVALYTHRREIAIMKLVGATNWFISSPFILESIAYGLLSALFGIGILFGLLRFVRPYVVGFFGSAQPALYAQFGSQVWQILGLEILVTTLLMVLSSSVAIRRYLKV